MQKEKKLIIVGIDGVRTDCFEKAKTPNIDYLIKNGVYSNCMHIVSSKEKMEGADTLSGPGWSHILTGVWPNKHKVKNNTFENHDLNSYKDIFTRIKENNPKSYTASFVSWKPVYDNLVKNCDLKFLEDFTSYSDSVEDKDELVDNKITKEAVKVIRENKDLTAAFVYLHQVDGIGHLSGFSPQNHQYIKAIERCDHNTGQLIEALESRKNNDKEDWLILVVTDHGGWEKDHAQGSEKEEITNVFWVLNGHKFKGKELKTKCYLTDIAPTALSHFNYNISYKDFDGSVQLPEEK